MSDEKRATDTYQADVYTDIKPDEVEVVVDHPEIVTAQELIDRCVSQASKFGVNSVTRLLLFNAARAIAELATRLDEAQKQRDKSTLVITDN
jgi:uncharacterized protein (UPF0261 family)